MQLTNEQVQEYLRHNGVICPVPKCGSDQVDVIEPFFMVDDGIYHEGCTCLKCGARWTDVYKITAIETVLLVGEYCPNCGNERKTDNQECRECGHLYVVTLEETDANS